MPVLFVIPSLVEALSAAVVVVPQFVSIHPKRRCGDIRWQHRVILRKSQRNGVPGDFDLGMHLLSATST